MEFTGIVQHTNGPEAGRLIRWLLRTLSDQHQTCYFPLRRKVWYTAGYCMAPQYGRRAFKTSTTKKKKKNALLQAQRTAALRVIRSYRTVSDMASLVLAKIPPVFLLASSRQRVAESRKSGNVLSEAEKTKEIIRQWQCEWDSTDKAAWTKRLIPELERWWFRGPNQVSFHIAQALTNHGCFQKYLWSRKKSQSPASCHFPTEIDDAEHTIFVCPFWDEAR
ncbi:hypothetical protein AGLY_013346 [Aphis glycines]|uniref:Reverse transcriptase zinc-binding domain-containing protein n=1 Tax=Aphis glycines TaxID=307491 RepID=A0A6G0T616_APHGL|nr:hypothetical protein AGLY_013346 [Aphis glycines]